MGGNRDSQILKQVCCLSHNVVEYTSP